MENKRKSFITGFAKFLETYLKKDIALIVLLCSIAVLSLAPIVTIYVFVGDSWRGIIPAFTDSLNFARIHTIGEGNLTDGNPFYMEHAGGPPLVLFGGAWLNAIPMWLGVPYNATLYINFLLWSLLFAVTLYWLLKEMRVYSWLAVFGVLFAYLESIEHVWRPANLQTVYPFVFIFYTALLRVFKNPNRTNVIVLALATGVSFYIFAFWWQIVVTTLGLTFLLALWKKDRALGKAILTASCIGGLIGLGNPLYLLWLSHTSPYFWESINRLGLVYTHFSTSFELYYVGRWIVLVCLFLALVFLKTKKEHVASERPFAIFAALTGVALLVMDGSYIITGRWLETEYHVRELILPWLVFITTALIAMLWRIRTSLSRSLKIAAIVIMGFLVIGNVRFATHYQVDFFHSRYQYHWLTLQTYAAPYRWLDEHEKSPVVVWVSPHHEGHLSSYLPIYTKHFVLINTWGNLELVSNDEVRERYLVSEYFNDPSIAQLKTNEEMGLYLGNSKLAYDAVAINHKIALCRAVFFWDANHDCGETVTPQSLLGDDFFTTLRHRFTDDIKPNIHKYLKKYHVKYILKDTTLNPEYQPQKLGASLVWQDERYQIWELGTKGS